MKRYNWTRIFWVSFPITIAITLVMPKDWPELIRWAPVLALWYIRGRLDQQGFKLAKTTCKIPEPIGHIECYCGEQIPIYGDVELTGEPGGQTAFIRTDTSALWLHSFEKHPDAHKEEA